MDGLTIATIALAIVTCCYVVISVFQWLATRSLARSALDQGRALLEQGRDLRRLADATADQSAATAATVKVASEQLAAFQEEARAAVVPILAWELRSQEVEIRPSGLADQDRLLVVQCRLMNYGPPAELRPVVDVLENSVSWHIDPRQSLVPAQLASGAFWSFELILGPSAPRSGVTPHVRLKIDARPVRLVPEWRPVEFELWTHQMTAGVYQASIRSSSSWHRA